MLAYGMLQYIFGFVCIMYKNIDIISVVITVYLCRNFK